MDCYALAGAALVFIGVWQLWDILFIKEATDEEIISCLSDWKSFQSLVKELKQGTFMTIDVGFLEESMARMLQDDIILSRKIFHNDPKSGDLYRTTELEYKVAPPT